MGGDFSLPPLASHLKLGRAPDTGGEPSWTLHDSVSNSYYKIDWVAFECIGRFSRYKTAYALKEAVERETTLKITTEHISGIVKFLDQNGLLRLGETSVAVHRGTMPVPFWKKILHTYLYITIPLFRPQGFLQKTYPRIAFLFSRTFVAGMAIFFAAMILWTLPRLDEFFHTFHMFFSLGGVLATLFVLAFVKIVHEFAHAYAAIRNGVKVPHMGIAFIVMYPVLYTETTGSWSLPHRRSRFHIAVAGITAELCLAAIFLGLWHFFPAGSFGQTASFLVVCVALVSSLLVNLNPLMRFDGYYMLSDVSGFDNLQARSISYARYRLRRFLFGLEDSAPELLPSKDEKFLTAFGLALLLYRFFLFLGIAILVYHAFFAPLGLILMLVELWWFIGLPLWSEIKIWIARKNDILAGKRVLFPAAFLTVFLCLSVMPWKTSVTLPAVVHAGEYRQVYAPAPSIIKALYVTNGQRVEEGDLLAELESSELDFKIRAARQKRDMLETLRRRTQANPLVPFDPALSDAAIEKARIELTALEEKKVRLHIVASFTGEVRDLNMALQEGRYIGTQESMFVLVNPASGTLVTAYVVENLHDRIKDGARAGFVSNGRDITLEKLSVRTVSPVPVDGALDWPELSSLYGGPLATDAGDGGEAVPRRTLYRVETVPFPSPLPVVQTGYLRVDSLPRSILISYFKEIGSLLRRELRLG